MIAGRGVQAAPAEPLPSVLLDETLVAKRAFESSSGLGANAAAWLQSPIDLVVTDLDRGVAPVLDWTQTAIEIIGNDHLDFHPVETNMLARGPVRYKMTGFHFHTPAEHALDGALFDAELHFVHTTEEGEVLVLGVLWRIGAFNPDLERLLQGVRDRPRDESGVEDFDMMSLLPTEASLYEYSGSFTTPPYGEGVAWLMYGQAQEASLEQWTELRDAIGGHTSRALQPRRGRSVRLAQ